MPGATGDYRTQFHAKAAAVAEALTEGRHDFVFLHVKAVDDTGHDRQPAQKVGGVRRKIMVSVRTRDGMRSNILRLSVRGPLGVDGTTTHSVRHDIQAQA